MGVALSLTAETRRAYLRFETGELDGAAKWERAAESEQTDEREASVSVPYQGLEEAAEGGYTARAVGASIFTQADDIAELEQNVREAVHCHFDDEAERPRIVRLHL